MTTSVFLNIHRCSAASGGAPRRVATYIHLN